MSFFPKAQVSGSVLPFNVRGKTEDDIVIVHFKVMDTDPNVRAEIASLITKQLLEQKVGGKSIVSVITGEEVTLSMTDGETIANFIAPIIMRRLGIPGPSTQKDLRTKT